MAEIFMPFYECFAFIAFFTISVEILCATFGVMHLVFGRKSELIRLIWGVVVEMHRAIYDHLRSKIRGSKATIVPIKRNNVTKTAA